MQENELKAFIKENSPFVFEYINSEILKDIGVMHPNFFVRLINEFFNKEDKRICIDEISVDTFAYYMLTEVLGEARQAYPFYRKDTMTLDELYKEVRVYYNYVRFTIEEDSFWIYLIQTKAGVTAFDEEIIKFSKKFPMKSSGIKEFISKNHNMILNESLKKVKEDINTILLKKEIK